MWVILTHAGGSRGAAKSGGSSVKETRDIAQDICMTNTRPKTIPGSYRSRKYRLLVHILPYLCELATSIGIWWIQNLVPHPGTAPLNSAT